MVQRSILPEAAYVNQRQVSDVADRTSLPFALPQQEWLNRMHFSAGLGSFPTLKPGYDVVRIIGFTKLALKSPNRSGINQHPLGERQILCKLIVRMNLLHCDAQGKTAWNAVPDVVIEVDETRTRYDRQLLGEQSHELWFWAVINEIGQLGSYIRRLSSYPGGC